MRRIGTLSNREEAERFGDFLLTQRINAQIDPADEGWAIWVHEEDRLDDARREWEAFRANPNDARFREAIVAADRLRHEEVRKRQQAKKQTVNMAERWRRPMIVQIPLTFALVVLSVVVTLGTNFGEEMNRFGGKLTMIEVRSGSENWRPVDPETGGDRRSDLGLTEIRHGQVWRLVTPIFFHMTWLHLIFNMYMTVMFGSLIETRQGSWRLLVVVLLTAIVSNLAQYYFKGAGFGGMSGVVYGLFGYLWILGRANPRSSIHMPANVVFFLLAWMVIGMTGGVGPIANYAHSFGLLSGMALGAARGTWEKATGRT